MCFTKLTERPKLGDIVYLHPNEYVSGQVIPPKPMTVTHIGDNWEDLVEVSWFVSDGSMHAQDIKWEALYKKLPAQVGQMSKAD